MTRSIILLTLTTILVGCDSGGRESPLVTLDNPPSVTSIPDQLGEVNRNLGPIAFTISDDLTPTGLLLLTVSSEDTSVIQDIIIGGSLNNRQLTIVPRQDQVGTTSVTLTVTDASGLSETVHFEVGFDLVDITFGRLARDVFAVSGNSEPTPINGFRVIAEETEFNDLLELAP